jgi:hypothetical protein
MTNEISRQPEHHIIGHARTIRTTLLCVEYLRARHGYPQSELRGDLIGFRFFDPTRENGFWSSDIFVDVYVAHSSREREKCGRDAR